MPHGKNVFNLTSLNGDNGFVIKGVKLNDLSGYSIGNGDINGDGIQDVLLGAPSFALKSGQVGTGYAVFGSKGSFKASIDLAKLNGVTGFSIDGAVGGSFVGYAISSGDINGDGVADALVGAPGYRGFEGRTYVLFGSNKPFPAYINVGSLDGTNGFSMESHVGYDGSGYSLSSADINGDGISDALIGANSRGSYDATAYIVYGSRTPFPAKIKLGELNGKNGFAITKIPVGNAIGFTIANGDINGDGISDVIIASAVLNSYVIFGSTSGLPAEINLNSLNGKNGFAIKGPYLPKNSYYSATVGSGDINGDGIPDVLMSFAGAEFSEMICTAFVVFGSRVMFPASINLTSLNGNNGFRINGTYVDSGYGFSVSSGDVNGDSIQDLLLGAPGADPGGAAYVVYGSHTAFPASISLENLDDKTGFKINGINKNDNAGYSIASGDINHDGIDDILLGAPEVKNDTGASYVVFGSSSFTKSILRPTVKTANIATAATTNSVSAEVATPKIVKLATPKPVTSSGSRLANPFSIFKTAASTTGIVLGKLYSSNPEVALPRFSTEDANIPVVECIEKQPDIIRIENSSVRVKHFGPEDTLHLETKRSITAKCQNVISAEGTPSAVIESEDAKTIVENVSCDKLNVPTTTRLMTQTFAAAAQHSLVTSSIPAIISGIAEGAGMSSTDAATLGKDTAFQFVLASGSYSAISSWYLTQALCDKYKVSQPVATMIGTAVSTILGTAEAVATGNTTWADSAAQVVATAAGSLAASIPANYMSKKVGHLVGSLACGFWSRQKTNTAQVTNQQHENPAMPSVQNRM